MLIIFSAIERIQVEEKDLSPVTQQQLKRRPRGFKISEKLIACLRDKSSYVCHVELLKYLLEMGLVLTGVIRVLAFSHEAIFSEYISSLVTLRRSSRSASKKNCVKFLLNSMYGEYKLSIVTTTTTFP